MKTALVLNAANPTIGGVLVRGEKGTAKSTAVRALANLLPEIEVVRGCVFSCDPNDEAGLCEDCRARAAGGPLERETRPTRVVDLPIGATEDRVVGTLDIEQVLTTGRRVFQPGVLAEANRGILYVDEVNLLEDHIVDLLLDAAAMGVNTVQREGISLTHAARFVLVGTMNPEEGELRPQLLDRFGLCAEVTGITDADERMEIVRRRAAWEAEPVEFMRSRQAADKELAAKIVRASDAIQAVAVSSGILRLVAEVCVEMGVQGHRADITVVQAARTLAALEGRDEVGEDDVGRVIRLCLTHRMRRLPFEEEPLDEDKLHDLMRRHRRLAGGREMAIQPSARRRAAGHAPRESRVPAEAPTGKTEKILEEVAEPVGVIETAPELRSARARATSGGNGKRDKASKPAARGRYVGSKVPSGAAKDPAMDATVRAAAAHNGKADGPLAVKVTAADLRDKIRVRKAGATILFCVDASGSMRARESMSAAKAAVMSLLVDAYKRRDKVGMVAFRGKRADVILPPTSSVELAQSRLQQLPTGGTTPLAHGLATSLSILSRAARQETESIPWLVLVTDGNANVPIGGGMPDQEARSMAACFRQRKIRSLVIDTARKIRSETLAKQIAEAAGSQYLRLDDLGADGLGDAVREKVRHTAQAACG